MNILVACKVVYDDQYIGKTRSGGLDFEHATRDVSTYDLNAIEAASQLAAAHPGTTVTALSVGAADIDDSKIRKSIIAHGVDSLVMVADDACADMDSFATAAELAQLVRDAGEWDLVLCGDGSDDICGRQVGVQLADRLGVPYVSYVCSIELDEQARVARCSRLDGRMVERLEVPLPAVLAVDPSIAQPRMCSVMDIMKAGRKPQSVVAASDPQRPTVETVAILAPPPSNRRCEVFDAGEAGGIRRFVELVAPVLAGAGK